MKKRSLLLACMVPVFNGFSQLPVTLTTSQAARRVDVSVGGKPFTAYIFPPETELKKAVLYPIRTAKGTLITRGWPLDPRPGERIDHPHHVGLWLNYEDVNGYDYWNNSTAIVESLRSHKFGTIRHTGISMARSGPRAGRLVVTADWLEDDGRGRRVLAETTTYVFSGNATERVIDRITTLKAVEDVSFRDVKDGMLGLRLARQLEMPSDKAEVFTDASGVATNVPRLDNAGITGSYTTSENKTGEAAWGTRGTWCLLTGSIAGEAIGVAILDHPQNPGFPTYWHARGYGLFAANPLGQAAFPGGKPFRFSLAKGQSATFRYRIIVFSGKPDKATLDARQAAFARTK